MRAGLMPEGSQRACNAGAYSPGHGMPGNNATKRLGYVDEELLLRTPPEEKAIFDLCPGAATMTARRGMTPRLIYPSGNSSRPCERRVSST